MEILGLLIPIVLVYVVYQHFAAPFKNIKRAKQQKLLVKALSDRVKTVMCDEVFLDRIKGFKLKMETYLKESENDALQKGKMYQTFGVCIGLAIGILLV